MAKPHPSPETLFWTHVDRTGGQHACWPWTATISDKYGHASVPVALGWPKRMERAHRLAFYYTHGWLPDGGRASRQVIRHKCDNPPCCNPDHLIVGTRRQNTGDAISRGRHVYPPQLTGEAHNRAKLTWEKVFAARRDRDGGDSFYVLAERYGVSRATIRRAVHGKTWRAGDEPRAVRT